MFTHEGSRLYTLDSFCRSVNQYDIIFNKEIHLNNVKIAQDIKDGKLNATTASKPVPAITEQGETNAVANPVPNA